MKPRIVMGMLFEAALILHRNISKQDETNTAIVSALILLWAAYCTSGNQKCTQGVSEALQCLLQYVTQQLAITILE